MASSRMRRCPRALTPSSFRSSVVRFGRTVSSISFSRNAASYLSRPRLRSQSPRSMVASQLRVGTGELSAAEGSEFRGAANRIALNRAGELKSHVHRISEGDFPG